MSANGTTTSTQSTTTSGYSNTPTPLLDLLKSNIQFILTLVFIVSSFAFYKFTVDGMQKVQASQAVEIRALQENYVLIGLQLAKIQTTLDESIKPDISTIKKDVKELQSRP